MEKRSRFVLLLIFVGLPVFTACDYVQDRFRQCRDLKVELANDRQSLQTVNLIADGESARSDNLVAPGGSRELVVCAERGDRKKFLAIRGNEIVAQATCVVSKANSELESSRARVVLEPVGLVCENW